MCEEIKKHINITNKEHVAWKCIADNSTKTRWYPLCLDGTFKRGAWQTALYLAIGFNCYTSRRAALQAGWSTSRKPVKVRIRRVQGYNYDRTIVFAQEIFVPRGR